MKLFDDPFAKLEADADEHIAALQGTTPPAAASVVEGASRLRTAIARTGSAFKRRRAQDLRAALEEVERRKDQEDIAAERAKNQRRIVLLETEVAALLSTLLSPERGTATAFYEARMKEIAAQIDAVRARVGDVEARLREPGAGSEMERSRDALAVAAAHDEARALALELDVVKKKLATVAAPKPG